MQEAQFDEQVGQEEVERAQTHNGHDVRGIDQKGMAGDGEDGGDGVQGEDYVGEFDGDEGKAEDRHHAATVFKDEELVLAKADGVDAGEPGDPARGVGAFFFVGGKDEADGGDEQDGGEEIADPLEPLEQAETGGDEGSAHKDCAGDSPEEDFGLMGGLDIEGAEEQKEDEEVVDGERLFDGVTGEVLGGGLGAEGEEEEEGEGEGGRDPEDGGGDCGGVSLCRALAADVDQLYREEREDEDMEADPMADEGGAEHLIWMLQGIGEDAQ